MGFTAPRRRIRARARQEGPRDRARRSRTFRKGSSLQGDDDACKRAEEGGTFGETAAMGLAAPRSA